MGGQGTESAFDRLVVERRKGTLASHYAGETMNYEMAHQRTMRNVAAVLLVCGVGACNIHDNVITIPNATINANTDASATTGVPATQPVPIAITVQNVYLVEQSATPPPEHMNDAGHIQVYLDDVETPPVLITAQVMFSVTLPAETKPGPHHLICRFHKHDGTPTTTQVSVAITVTASVGADGGVDVNTSVDANVTTDAPSGAGGEGGAKGAGGAAGSGTVAVIGVGGVGGIGPVAVVGAGAPAPAAPARAA